MKKLFCAIILLVMASSASFALSDAEYKVLMKNKSFAAADKALNSAWKDAASMLYGSDIDNLKESQRQWIKTGRDRDAQALMKRNKLSKAEAYAQVTNARADYIMQYIRDNTEPYERLAYSMNKVARQISQSTKPSAQSGRIKAWKGKNYIVVFEVNGKENYLARFWTTSKQHVFDDCYYPGMRLSDAKKYLDTEGYGDDETYVVGGIKQVVEFGINGNTVSYINFVQSDIPIPEKIQSLFDEYE